MNSQVSKADNFAQRRNSISNVGLGLVQTVQCLADDLERAFDRRLRTGVANVRLAVQTVDETLDFRAGPVDIRGQDAGIRTL